MIPTTIILLLAWLSTRKRIYGKAVGFIWLGMVGLIIVSVTIKAFVSKKTLKKHDFYGQYIVDRNYFRGTQADWQYDNFRFEIQENDSVYLYVTNGDRMMKTFIGTITTSKQYGSERLVVNMKQPGHHIFQSNPTIYRNPWSFYMVFNSPRFGNMFFKKGSWNPR
ncbi:hypothetical protein QG516_13875 [Pedobacter gandavensis]|uniref:hypothetical protein n=1 Tax=Pedobacter gandavensis TaxID=2679963 RepID=UPI00247AF435|nr:hypothetical protein [Pedobacter gandavensis]WGQ07656.1 hypothetical protein QG516_13875 [Pedobacter gandavensis]